MEAVLRAVVKELGCSSFDWQFRNNFSNSRGETIQYLSVLVNGTFKLFLEYYEGYEQPLITMNKNLASKVGLTLKPFNEQVYNEHKFVEFLPTKANMNTIIKAVVGSVNPSKEFQTARDKHLLSIIFS